MKNRALLKASSTILKKAKEYAGEDTQLNKAIEVILKDLENYDKQLPPIPEAPDKSE